MKKNNLKIKLIINEDFYNQYMYINSLIPDREWYGEVFYKLEISDEVVRIEPKMVVLKNIGTTVSIDYYPEDRIEELAIDFFEKFPEIMELDFGSIHSHHKMSDIPFSHTDAEDLKNNTPKDNGSFYLSMVVYNNGKVDAHVGVNLVAESNIFGFNFKSTNFVDLKITDIEYPKRIVNEKWQDMTDNLFKELKTVVPIYNEDEDIPYWKRNKFV